MDIIEWIIKASLFAVNTFAVSFIVVMVSKWHNRIENKLNCILKYIEHVTDRNDIVYINQLERLKKDLIENEHYEDAEKISKCIGIEYENLRKGMSEKPTRR